MASSNQHNPFMSTHKSDSDLHIVLHPLVLLTISDYITRHTLRGQTQPIVGAILGRQDGRAITMEHAFECAAESNITGGAILVEPWFTERLEQMKLVHKDCGLDLVGWYTLLPRAGPNSEVILLHNQILAINESAAILAVHPDEIITTGSNGGRLPISIYETVYETEEQRREGGEDKVMKDSGDNADDENGASNSLVTTAADTNIRFRELPYSVETGEAEMISMDFVARGGANATASAGTDQQQQGLADDPKKKQVPSLVKADAKGKRRAVAKDDAGDEGSMAAAAIEPAVLSRAEEELVATLATKANAIKMLHARIQLIIKYLEGLPPSYLASSGETPSEPGASATTEPVSTSTASTDNTTAKDSSASTAPPPSPTLLRSIQALVNRIPLLIPFTTEAFEREMLSEANDVHLVSLLNDVMQSVNELRDLGKKFHIVEQARNRRQANDHSSLMGGIMGLTEQQRISLNVGDLLM